MIAPSPYYVLLCNILKCLCVRYLENWLLFWSFLFFLFFFTWHVFSNCWFYHSYMLPVILLFVYLLFMHCYCFTNANCIVLHSFVRISCLLYLLCHLCFCDILILTCFIFNCQFTDVGFVKHVCVCSRARVRVCVRARARPCVLRCDNWGFPVRFYG